MVTAKNNLRGANCSFVKAAIKTSPFVALLVLFFLTCSDANAGTNERRGVAENLKGRLKHEFMMLRTPSTGKIPDNIRVLELRYAQTLPTSGPKPVGKGAASLETSIWTSLGPFNVGGRTRALAVDVANPDVMLAGGVSGGMWRSSDGGRSWHKTTGAVQLQSVSCVAQDTRPGHTSVYYYGTGELVGNSASGEGARYRGDGIFKSTDNGETWFPLPSTQSGSPQRYASNFQYVWGIAIDPLDSTRDVVYAATYGAIERSTDGGTTWHRVLGDGQSGAFADVRAGSNGTIYATLSSDAGQFAGIWRSTAGDSGAFANITPGGWPTVYNRIVLDVAPSDPNEVYFLAETPGAGLVLPNTFDEGTDGYSLWKYTDGAQPAWDDRSSNIPAFGGIDGNFDCQGSYDLLLKVKPDDPDFVVIGGTNLYRSTDGFSSAIARSDWIGGYDPHVGQGFYAYPGHHEDQQALLFLPSDPAVVVSGNDGGVHKTYDVTAPAVTWTSLNNGYNTAQFVSVAMDEAQSGDNVLLGGTQDNGGYFFNSANPKAPWFWVQDGDGSISAIANGKSFYYMGRQNGEVRRLTFDAEGNESTWARVDPRGGADYLFIAPFVLDPNNSNMMYLAAGDSVWRNSDLSRISKTSNSPTSLNWSLMTHTASSGGVVSALGISKTPANILYYATEYGKVYRVENANSGDPMPVDISSGKGLPDSAYVSCVAVDREGADSVMLVFSNYGVRSLYYTSDGGNAWTDVSGNLEQNPDGSGAGPSCRWATILHYGAATTYYVATSTGLYSTTELNGASTIWSQEGPASIGNIVCNMVISRESDGRVVVATHGNGVYTATPMSTTGDLLISYDQINSPYEWVNFPSQNFGDIVANLLTTPTNSVKIDKLMYYIFGDRSTGNASFYPVIYLTRPDSYGIPDDSAFYTGPLYTPSVGWNTIDISSENVILPGNAGSDFLVGLKYDGTDQPKIGQVWPSNGRGWLYSNSSWTQLDIDPTLSISLCIRAYVTEVPTAVDNNTTVPKDFAVGQNYPNPFNPSTTIKYTVAGAGGQGAGTSKTMLAVYDLLGRKVATLVDESQAPGTYEVRFDARGLASGVYLYRLTAGNFVQTRKMLVVK